LSHYAEATGYSQIIHSAIVSEYSFVSGHALVKDWAHLAGQAILKGNATLCDYATLGGYAFVEGDVIIGGNLIIYEPVRLRDDSIFKNREDIFICRNTWSSGRTIVYSHPKKMWKVGCFYGSGEKLIKKAYSDSFEKGREYERLVQYVNSMYKALDKNKCKTEKIHNSRIVRFLRKLKILISF